MMLAEKLRRLTTMLGAPTSVMLMFAEIRLGSNVVCFAQHFHCFEMLPKILGSLATSANTFGLAHERHMSSNLETGKRESGAEIFGLPWCW